MTSDVLVSYASEDKQFARRLAMGLRDAGLQVGFDAFALEAGDSLRRSIDKGLHPRISTTRLLAATLLLVPAASSVWGSDGDSPALPALDCGVSFAEGTFFGYSPPKAGDRLHLDLGRITGTLDQLQFLPDSHIPLVRPLKVIKETRDGEGRLQAMRLRSAPNEDWMLTIDVQSYPRAGASMAKVWILHEQPWMASIAVLDCRFAVPTGWQY